MSLHPCLVFAHGQRLVLGWRVAITSSHRYHRITCGDRWARNTKPSRRAGWSGGRVLGRVSERVTVSHTGARDEWYKWSPAWRILTTGSPKAARGEGPISATDRKQTRNTNALGGNCVMRHASNVTPAPPIGRQVGRDILASTTSLGTKVSRSARARKRHFRSKLLPALIVSAKRASRHCDVEVVVVRLDGGPCQLPDGMRYSCFDNRSGGNKISRSGARPMGQKARSVEAAAKWIA